MFRLNTEHKRAMDIGKMLDKGLFFSVVNRLDGRIVFQAMHQYQCARHKTKQTEIIKTSSLLEYLKGLKSVANG